jgi:hypothetical protein
MVEVTVLTEPQLHQLQLHLGVEEEVVEEVVDQEEVEVVVDQVILDQQHLTLLDIIDQEFQGELLAWEEVIGEVMVEEGVEEGVEGVEEVVEVEILQVEDLHQEDLEAAALPPVEGNQMLASGPTTS